MKNYVFSFFKSKEEPAEEVVTTPEPEQRTKHFNFMMTKSLYEKLQACSKIEGLSMATIINDALLMYFEKHV